ncbi:MAG: hypothetical protein DDG59_00585 [Anaerolineae bacterium]|jgi:cobalamin biosynthesis protein CobD/CbiB|nr:MAG: hypothetical protein DDG59_00585 [Anaerolineae bacterium]
MVDEVSNPDLTIEEVIQQLNEQLLKVGASSAEQSFGLAVWLGTLPILAVVAVLLAFKVINIILAFFLGIILFVIFFAATAILASQARRNAIQRAIKEQTIPQIQTYLANYRVDVETFHTTAQEMLPTEAPLLEALGRMVQPIESTRTDDER